MILTQATGIIMGPITWLLGTIFNAIYNLFFAMGVESIALSIVLFTIFVRLILFPFNLKTTKSSKIQQHLRPEFNKINKKYKGKKDVAVLFCKENPETSNRLQFTGVIVFYQLGSLCYTLFPVIIEFQLLIGRIIGHYFFYIFKHRLLRSNDASSSKLHQ